MEWALVVLVTFAFAFLNYLHVVIPALHVPPHTVFVGITHWYEDYFYYLSQLTQGARGAWTLVNAYTTESIPMGLNWWFNLLLGKFMYVVPVAPWVVYDTVVFVLSLAYILLMYRVFCALFPSDRLFRLGAWIIALTSTGLFTVSKTATGYWVTPYTYFYSASDAFNRLGGVAHLVFQNIISLLFLVQISRIVPYLSRKNWHQAMPSVTRLSAAGAVLLVALFLVSPFYVAIDILIVATVALTILLWYRKISVLSLLCLSAFVLLAPLVPFALIQKDILSHPFFAYMRSWEMGMHQVPPLTMLMATGVLVFLLPIGIVPYLRKATPLRVAGFLFATVPLLFYYSPLPKTFGIPYFRILQPPAYVFLAAIAMEGIGLLSRILSFGKKRLLRIMSVLLLAMFVAIQVPTLRVELKNRVTEYYLNSPINYLNRDVYEGLLFLRKQPHDKIAIAIDMLEYFIPVISGHSVYVGHTTLTYDYERKINEVIRFFARQYTPDQAYAFLTTNNIGYVLWPRDGQDYKKLPTYYPFLRILFGNSKVVIFGVQQ